MFAFNYHHIRLCFSVCLPTCRKNIADYTTDTCGQNDEKWSISLHLCVKRWQKDSQEFGKRNKIRLSFLLTNDLKKVALFRNKKLFIGNNQNLARFVLH